jgi:hypothetical protein
LLPFTFGLVYGLWFELGELAVAMTSAAANAARATNAKDNSLRLISGNIQVLSGGLNQQKQPNRAMPTAHANAMQASQSAPSSPAAPLLPLHGCTVLVHRRVDGDLATQQAVSSKLEVLGAALTTRLGRAVTHVIALRKLMPSAAEAAAQAESLRELHDKLAKAR